MATQNRGMNMHSFSRQDSIDNTDMSLASTRSSMPNAMAMFGDTDPRIFRDARFDENLKNLESAFSNPTLIVEQFMQDNTEIPEWARRMFPLAPPSNSIADEVIHQVIPNPTTMDALDDFGMPSTVSYSEVTRVIRVTEVGKAIEFNHKDLLTNGSTDLQRKLALQFRTVFKARIYTMMQYIHAAIREAPLLSQTIPIPNERNYSALFATEIMRFAAVSLKKNGIYALLQNIWTDRMALQNSRPPTIVVVGPLTKELQVHGGDDQEVWRKGESSQALIEGRREPLPSYRGATVYQESTYNVENEDGRRMDPMVNKTSIGLHYTVPVNNGLSAAKNGCYDVRANNTLVIHDHGLDALVDVSFEELLDANPYYLPDGSLNRTGLESVLANYQSMSNSYRTKVPVRNGVPLVDPHIASMGDPGIDSELYVASYVGESDDAYFSQDRLQTTVYTARKHIIDTCGQEAAEHIEWLRQQMLRAYRGSIANVNGNIEKVYVTGRANAAQTVRIGSGAGNTLRLKDTDAIGLPTQLTDEIASSLEPTSAVLPDGCATINWVHYFAQNTAARRAGIAAGADAAANPARPAPSAKDLEKLRDAARYYEMAAREFKGIFDVDGGLDAHSRNAVCTINSLPIHQIPSGDGMANADKEQLELFAVAQNALFFVGMPLTVAKDGGANANVNRAPLTVNKPALENAGFGPRANISDEFLANVQNVVAMLLRMPSVNPAVKNMLAGITPEDFKAKITDRFTEAYAQTNEKPDFQNGNVNKDTAMRDFVQNIVFGNPAAVIPENERDAKAQLFATFVQDVSQNSDRFFSKTRLVRITSTAEKEFQRMQDVGAAAGRLPYGGGGNGRIITAFTHAPSARTAASGADYSTGQPVNPFTTSTTVAAANRKLARGVSSTDDALGSSTIFSAPELMTTGSGGGSSSGQMMHGGAGFDDPYTGEHSLTEGAIRSIPEGSPLLSPGVMHAALLNPTFARRITEAGKRSNAIVRACEICALCAPFHKSAFLNQYRNDVQPLITMKVWYPNIRFLMNCAYAGVDGVGKTRMEFPVATPGFDVVGKVTWKIDMYVGAGIIDEHNISVVHNTMFREYLGGMSVRSLTRYESHASADGFGINVMPRYGDGFVTTVGVAFDDDKPIVDLTGMYVSRSHQGLPIAARQQASDLLEDMQYSGALYHSMFLKDMFPVNNYTSVDNHLNYYGWERWMRGTKNTICHRGPQYMRNYKGQDVCVREGWGFGKNIVPGRMREVFAGQSMLNTEATVKTI